MPLKDEAQQLIDTLNELGLPPFETLPVEAQREMFGAKTPDVEPPAIHQIEDTTAPGPAGEVAVRVFRPSDKRDLPVVVYFHGGGWVVGSLDSHDATCRLLANNAEAVVVSVDYRMAPEDRYPAAVDDCLAVTAWVAANGDDGGWDGSRLAVAGDSAGGNLAAAVALAARDQGPAVSAQVLVYPATNLVDAETPSYLDNGERGYLLTKGWMNWFIDQYIPDHDRRGEPLGSPALAESHAGLPPAIILTAQFDPLLDDGANYASLLRDAGVDVVYEQFEGQIHGFFSAVGTMEDSEVGSGMVAEFLKGHW